MEAFVAGAADGSIPDYQIAALLMAIVWRGLSRRELEVMTAAMIASGDRLDLSGVPGPKIDKHSTGGVGDKITLCLGPLVAACGIKAPMLVGRALGHTGGTLDKLEAIAGWQAQVPPARFRTILRRAGFVIAGQSARIVPADRRLYALRDATATVESLPLIASSIVSKKVAGGADGLVLDVKLGRGAFLPSPQETRVLARLLLTLARRFGLPSTALLTDMDQPLGQAVGNANELCEAIDVLRGAGPPDTRALTLALGAEMLLLGKVSATRAAARARLEAALASGAGLERLCRAIELQGGDPRVIENPGRLPRARLQRTLRASRPGYVSGLDARAVGQAASLLGAGRLAKEDRVDPAVGIQLAAKRGEWVERGQPLATLWYNDPGRVSQVLTLLEGAYTFSARPPRPKPLIVKRLP